MSCFTIEPPATPPVCILAGGSSSRFPGDKALVQIGDLPQILHLIRQLQAQRYEVAIVADRADRYSEFGIQSLVDAYPGCGPMGGLVSGLEHRVHCHGPGWLLLLGCDQLVWHHQWLDGMAQILSEGDTENWLVGLWESGGPHSTARPNPLPGLYHTCLLPQLHQQCQSGQLSMQSILQTASAKVFYDATLATHPREYSFNTPDQLAALIQLL